MGAILGCLGILAVLYILCQLFPWMIFVIFVAVIVGGAWLVHGLFIKDWDHTQRLEALRQQRKRHEVLSSDVRKAIADEVRGQGESESVTRKRIDDMLRRLYDN